MRAGLKPAARSPLLGDACLISAITAGECRVRAARKSRRVSMLRAVADSRSDTGGRGRASSCRFCATILARISGTVSIKGNFHGIKSAQFVDVAGPVVAEQAGEGAIGEKPAVGLAAWTVVGLVGCVADASDFGAADRTGLLILAMHGH